MLAANLLSAKVIGPAAGSLAAAALIAYQAHLQPLPPDMNGPVSAAASAGSKEAAVPGITIASDGLVHLRDARVVSISGNAIEVSVSFDGDDFAWIADTSAATKFPDGSGRNQSISAIRSGDIVDVTGELQSGGATPTLAATFVRD